MKKLFLALVGLSIILSSAYAECQRWEHGQKIRPDQPNGSVPPKPYCWQVDKVYGAIKFSDTDIRTNIGEMIKGKPQSDFDFYAFYQKHLYGEMYRGVVVSAEVFGFPQSAPRVTLGSTIGVLIGQENIPSPSGQILNGTRYYFYLRHKPESQLNQLSDWDVHGTLQIAEGFRVDKSIFIK